MTDDKRILQSTGQLFTAELRTYIDETTTFCYVWCRSRVLIKFTRATHTRVTFNINDTNFTSNENGVLWYDATDDAREALTRANKRFDIDVTCDGDDMTLECVSENGINPSEVVMPRIRNGQDFETENPYYNEITQIVPPNVIYTSPGISETTLEMEIRGALELCDWFQKNGTYVQVEANKLTILADNVYIEAANIDENYSCIFPFTVLGSCDNSVCLAWYSLSGVAKKMIWRVRDIKQLNEHAELQPLGNDYIYMTGGETRITAYIEGLDAYSYAYYADILRSPSVRLVEFCNEMNTFINDRQNAEVEIVPQDISVPCDSFGGVYTLEIEIRYKKYDTL